MSACRACEQAGMIARGYCYDPGECTGCRAHEIEASILARCEDHDVERERSVLKEKLAAAERVIEEGRKQVGSCADDDCCKVSEESARARYALHDAIAAYDATQQEKP